jgi:hypothetical protein
MENRAVYYANGLVEPAEPPNCPHHLAIGGHPALLAEVCELVDKVAELEMRLAKLEEAHAPGIIADTSRRDMVAIAWKDCVGP